MDYLNFASPQQKNNTWFSIQRNGTNIGRFLGDKKLQYGKTYINFPDSPEIIVGDIVCEEKTNARYKVIDIQAKEDPAKQFLRNHYEFFHVFVENLDEIKTPSYNINANGSVVSINSTINSPISISSLQQQIDNCLPEDKELAHELVQALKEIEQSKKPIKRNALQKFGDFLVKYSPIAVSVGQIIVQILSATHH